MNFKQWLTEDGYFGVGSATANQSPSNTAGGSGEAGLSSGSGGGSSVGDNWGNRLELPRKKRKRPPLAKLAGMPKSSAYPPGSNIEYDNDSMNSGSSGSFA